MLRTTLLTTTVLLTLSGCARVADSRLNPLNWFGGSREVSATTTQPEIRALVPENSGVMIVEGRPFVQAVTALTVDRTPTGAIVRASGTVATQGYFNAQLINTGVSSGVLTLEFRAEAPTDFEATGTARSRQITAAYVINANDLAAIRTVRVQAATNARTSAR